MFLPEFEDDYLPEGYVRIASGKNEGLICRKEYLDLTKEEKERICNGIGASTGLSKHFPNTVWGLNIKECGDIHDYDYYVGGSKEDKIIADKVLLRNCRYMIKNACILLRYPRYMRVNKYYIAVSIGGDSHFNFTK